MKKTESRPTTVPIMGTPFLIQYAKKVDGGKAIGLMMGNDHKIVLQSDLAGRDLETVLLHETLHALLYVSGHSEQLTEEQEEGIVLALEHGLSQLYQRIPK